MYERPIVSWLLKKKGCMKFVRVNMKNEQVSFEEIPEEWKFFGGSGLIAKILNREVAPDCNSLGADNRFVVATGPLAGTMAPHLGRISVGAKSPLTNGIKEANAGGPAGQYLDRLGIRSVIIEDLAESDKLYIIRLKKDGVELLPGDEYKNMKNYQLAKVLQEKYGKKNAIICTGIAGERMYRGASVSFTDSYGDPSRNAARGGLGAVMGSKGLKAIVVEGEGLPKVDMASPTGFKQVVKDWTATIQHDIGCSMFKKSGTPFAVSNSANQGSMPYKNYRSGRPENFLKVSDEAIQQVLFERGGKMHGCMPGCQVRCSIIYPDKDGSTLASAYEYEGIAMLGTNLGIEDLDAIARLKFICDDIGVDFIEMGSALGIAAEAGKMNMGDWESAAKLLEELEEGTVFGEALGHGVVETAKVLDIDRVPAIGGQSIPGHDPRAVKGTGVTYLTSPMGADHTAGLTYRMSKSKKNQVNNSLRSQIESAVCDTMGYCLNAVPGARSNVYQFLADLMNSRYGTDMAQSDIIEMGKQTLREQLLFNEGSEFAIENDFPDFIRTEEINQTGDIFDVDESEIKTFWEHLDAYQEKEKTWEIRIPPLPDISFGAGVVQKMGPRLRSFGMKNALIVTDPVMDSLGRTAEIQKILKGVGIGSTVFSEIIPDPPIELIESVSKLYKDKNCDAVIGVGGGSSMDSAKAIALRVSHPGDFAEYESIVGGTGKIKNIMPPIICIPTTSGTGSEVNPYAVITNKVRDVKFMLMSNFLIPKLAVIDPLYCQSMPPGLTVESGVDALAHCIEGYVSLAIQYHPYFESMALYGTKLIGRSLPKVYKDGKDVQARTDMCMGAVCGGIAFLKGLGLGHAITHTLGAHYHLPHGRAAIIGLLCFVRVNKKACQEQFTDLAFALNRCTDLEEALLKFYKDLDISVSLKAHGIKKEDLEAIAFHVYNDTVNVATNPATVSHKQIYDLLVEIYD